MSVGKFLQAYFVWHYGSALLAWWRIYGNLLWFLYNFFSVSLLVRTLFSPWRRLGENYPAGFRPGAAAETLVVNLLMRLFGLLVRLLLLVFAVFALAAAFVLGWLALGLWLLSPLLILGSFLVGFYLLFLA